jgi:hypothetical protein
MDILWGIFCCHISFSVRITSGKQEGSGISDAELTDATVSRANLTDATVGGSSLTGVVIMSSSGTTLANFQVWRSTMVMMKQLQIRAADYKCPSAEREKTLGVPGLDIASQAITLVQGVLAMFASNESAMGVQGTIQDQALVDGVARQLRALDVPVLVPDTYGPFTLSGVDYKNSPFLGNLGKLTRCRICLQAILRDPSFQLSKSDVDALTAKRKDYTDKKQADQKEVDEGKLSEKDRKAKEAEIDQLDEKIQKIDEDIKKDTVVLSQVNEITALIASIDSFLASLTGNSASTPGPGAQTANPSTSPASGPSSGPSGPQSGSTPAIAAGDDGSASADSIWQHVLFLRALESGGSLITHSNIFGSKVFFSGGAVATYSLFTLKGRLTCSGNVYDYGGYIRAKDFAGIFRDPNIDPRQQLIFLRGGCRNADNTINP